MITIVTRPESHPEYLRHTIEAFLDVMREAEALTQTGDVGPEFPLHLQAGAQLNQSADFPRMRPVATAG